MAGLTPTLSYFANTASLFSLRQWAHVESQACAWFRESHANPLRRTQNRGIFWGSFEGSAALLCRNRQARCCQVTTAITTCRESDGEGRQAESKRETCRSPNPLVYVTTGAEAGAQLSHTDDVFITYCYSRIRQKKKLALGLCTECGRGVRNTWFKSWSHYTSAM